MTPKLDNKKIESISPTVLAFVGDAVFSLYVRGKIVEICDGKSGLVTAKCNTLVNAKAQAKMLDNITEYLTEEEKDISRRCRNTHLNNKAKNAELIEYKASTAFEGVIGWLWLKGDEARAVEIMEKAIK
ncbi:MAG: Mini-ribonuclease 3 [Firmicutes bacterium]|nr:Mini-ribonuclease 3 [Bacillota bacterium]